MKVFYGTTTSEFETYKEWYFKIRSVIIANNCVLTRDWLPLAEEKVKRGQRTYDPKEVFVKVNKALEEAELIIIEDTISSFSTGYQITFALQRNKPLLIIYRGNKKPRYFKNSLLEGALSENVVIKKCDENNIVEVIKEFINRYKEPRENRFNLVLTDYQRKYLDWAQFNTKKSRTKIIREALDKFIDHDKGYSKYK